MSRAGRPDGAHRAARRRRVRAHPLRVPPERPADSLPLADRYHIPYPVAEPDDPERELTVREHGGAPEVPVPRSAWRFARRMASPVPVLRLSSTGGFEPGRSTTATTAPRIRPWWGSASPRSGTRRPSCDSGPPAAGNPCAGRSTMPTCSASRRADVSCAICSISRWTKTRRAGPSSTRSSRTWRGRGAESSTALRPALAQRRHSIGMLFPFTDVEQEDPVSGQRGALARAAAPARTRVPKIFTINSSAEYWRGDGSLVHTDVTGQRDVAPPPGVRIYLLAGTQHTPGAFPPPPADPNTGGRGRHPFSLVDYSPLLRAALVNLDRWVGEGAEPPPEHGSRGSPTAPPSAADHTRKVFESIPGATFPDRVARTVPARLRTRGRARHHRRSCRPRSARRSRRSSPPSTRDGNETAGIRPVELRVPLATYHRLEPAAPRARGARRPHEHDGLDLPLRAHRRRA